VHLFRKSEWTSRAGKEHMQKRLNVRGHTISFKDEGHGPSLVLLHGYGGSPHDWEHLVAPLTKKYRVIVPNLSHLVLDPADKVSFKMQIEILSEFLGRIFKDGETTHILASSYGGALAWGLSIYDPRRIDRLILLSPMPPNPIPRIRIANLRRVLQLGRWPQLLWLFFHTKWGRRVLPQIATHFNVGWLKKSSARFEKLSGRKIRLAVHVVQRFAWLTRRERWEFWNTRIRLVESPVCLIWGSEDRLFMASEPERLQSIFPHCRLHRIHGAGHLIAKESPTQVEAIIDSFILEERKSA
jgi:pimeloyl-ACP methyl ester carboxylesterase